MSLDVYLTSPDCEHCKRSGEELFTRNITHNLGKLAAAVDLYDPLWHPEEIGATRAEHLIDLLERGLARLEDPARRDELKALEPSNGWGKLDNLIDFTREYLEACRESPDALVLVSR